jgi:hypothetical protein
MMTNFKGKVEKKTPSDRKYQATKRQFKYLAGQLRSPSNIGGRVDVDNIIKILICYFHL